MRALVVLFLAACGNGDPNTINQGVGSDDACMAGSPDGHVCDPANTKKTTICHIPPGNPANQHTLCVGNAAVKAHLAHGDHLGACDAECTPPPSPSPGDTTGGTTGTPPVDVTGSTSATTGGTGGTTGGTTGTTGDTTGSTTGGTPGDGAGGDVPSPPPVG